MRQLTLTIHLRCPIDLNVSVMAVWNGNYRNTHFRVWLFLLLSEASIGDCYQSVLADIAISKDIDIPLGSNLYQSSQLLGWFLMHDLRVENTFSHQFALPCSLPVSVARPINPI